MHEIVHLLGVGTDGNLYGTASPGSGSGGNVTVLSKDAGLNWGASYHDVALSEPAQQYFLDVNQLTVEPLDNHVIHGSVNALHWHCNCTALHSIDANIVLNANPGGTQRRGILILMCNPLGVARVDMW